MTIVTASFATDANSSNAIPDYYPKKVDSYGIFKGVVGANQIIINGETYYINSSTKIYTTKTKYGSINDLTDGDAIGFKSVDPTTNDQLLSEIYAFPLADILAP